MLFNPFSPKFQRSFKFFIFGIFLLNLLFSTLPYPQMRPLLGFSFDGFFQGYYWQPLSALFLQNALPFSLGKFLSLSIELYLLWVFAFFFIAKEGFWKFLFLVFFGGIFSSFSFLGILKIFQNSSFSCYSLEPLIYSLLFSWVFLNPNSRFLAFRAIPFQTKPLVYTFLGLRLFFIFIQEEFLLLLQYGIFLVVSTIICSLFSHEKRKKIFRWPFQRKKTTPKTFSKDKFLDIEDIIPEKRSKKNHHKEP